MSYQVSSVLIADKNNNLSSEDWLLGVTHDTLEGNENGLFNGNFVPPPPRPIFLEDGVTPDGLTTCDLCAWAWKSGNPYTTESSIEPSSELGWVLTLVIVSITSAVLGAIVMIVVFQCRRSKKLQNTQGGAPQQNAVPANRPPISTPDDKITIQQNYSSSQDGINGVWSWLSRRSAITPTQLDHSGMWAGGRNNPPISVVENHYTHMDDPYNDALYAELDAQSTLDRKDNLDPAYNNSAYTDSDAPSSSAPSSAYYSDLSTGPAYEVVGLTTMPVWDKKLDVISENVSNVPSDYV